MYNGKHLIRCSKKTSGAYLDHMETMKDQLEKGTLAATKEACKACLKRLVDEAPAADDHDLEFTDIW